MFETLLTWLYDPQFWFIVTAVVTGGIIIRALPYVLVALAYLLGAIVAVLAFIVGIFLGIGQAIGKAVREAWDK